MFMGCKLTKKIIALTFVLLFATLIFSNFTIQVNAEMQQPTLKKGYYWNYKTTWYNYKDLKKVNGYANSTARSQENITINDTKFHVWKIVTDFYILGKTAMRWTVFYNYSDLSLLKHVQNSSNKEIDVDYTTVYFNPKSFWPISNNTKINYTTTVGGDYNKTDWTKKTTTFIECLGMVEIQTDIGSFNCYKLLFYNLGEKDINYRIEYYSPKIGWIVKTEIYKNGEIDQSGVLQSYHAEPYTLYGKEKTNEKDNNFVEKIFLLSVLIALITILIMIFYSIKKRKK
jgi:hypothetical protein